MFYHLPREQAEEVTDQSGFPKVEEVTVERCFQDFEVTGRGP